MHAQPISKSTPKDIHHLTISFWILSPNKESRIGVYLKIWFVLHINKKKLPYLNYSLFEEFFKILYLILLLTNLF